MEPEQQYDQVKSSLPFSGFNPGWTKQKTPSSRAATWSWNIAGSLAGKTPTLVAPSIYRLHELW
jgi:hypothetical protein